MKGSIVLETQKDHGDPIDIKRHQKFTLEVNLEEHELVPGQVYGSIWFRDVDGNVIGARRVKLVGRTQ
jgi:hypothetical protein